MIAEPMRTIVGALGLLSLLLAAVVGCASPTRPDSPSSDKSAIRSTQTERQETVPPPVRRSTDLDEPSISGHGYGGLSNDGTYYITYLPSPDPIPLNQPFSLTVEVRDGTDHSNLIADAQLQADAAMPHHRHGMNTRPRVYNQGGGRFTVSGMLFHMPGYWELYLDIVRAGLTERAQFAHEL